MTNDGVFEYLTSLAKEREDIRVLALNGSLVNPNVMTDRFQGVDVTCFVEDVTAFIEDRSWLSGYLFQEADAKRIRNVFPPLWCSNG